MTSLDQFIGGFVIAIGTLLALCSLMPYYSKQLSEKADRAGTLFIGIGTFLLFRKDIVGYSDQGDIEANVALIGVIVFGIVAIAGLGLPKWLKLGRRLGRSTKIKENNRRNQSDQDHTKAQSEVETQKRGHSQDTKSHHS